MAKPKMFFTSMDDLFRFAAIDPDLPNPATYEQRTYRRALSKMHTGQVSSFGPYDTGVPGTSVHEEETFHKEYLMDGATGQRIWYWRKA